MADRKDKKRKPPISYRPPVEREEEFYARLEKSGLNINAFITWSVFRLQPPPQARRASPEQKNIVHLMDEARRVVDEMKLRREQGSRNDEDVREAVALLKDIRNAVFEIRGYKP